MRPSKAVLPMHGWKVVLCAAGVFVLVGAFGGCVSKPEVKQGKGRRMSPRIDQVLQTHRDEWLSIPGVVGTAIGQRRGKPCIRVLVARRTKEIATRIPGKVDGYPVLVEETGPLRGLARSLTACLLRPRARPTVKAACPRGGLCWADRDAPVVELQVRTPVAERMDRGALAGGGS